MEEKNELRSKLHIPTDAKVLTYLGSIGGWYMMNEMFNFFRHLIQKDPSYHMLILTKDAPEEVLRAAREVDVSLKNLTVTYAARSQLPVFLSLSHSSIFFIRNTYSKMASSPTKHAELMGMGIPVICNDIGDTGNIIRQTGTGMLVDNFDDQSLDNAVSQVSNLESIFPEQIRKSALDLFDLRNGSKIYLSIYNRILKKPEQQEVS
jgi:glycosyltransferase involved in cell wall biosynthesis